VLVDGGDSIGHVTSDGTDLDPDASDDSSVVRQGRTDVDTAERLLQACE
jgi:hypothetical protein